MITLEINNNKFKASGNLKVLNRIYKDLKVRHPGAYFVRPHMPRGWDGKIDYMTEQGYCRTGLLPLVASLIEKYEEEYITIDNRKLLEINKIPRSIGNFKAREYQIEAVESIVYNTVGDISYPRGIIGAATNAGKTLITAMIHSSFNNAKTIILINNKLLFDQFMDDMPQLFGDGWGYMQGKNIKWGNIMICMLPTLYNNLYKYQAQIATFNVVLFDECHLAASKTSKKVLTALYNTEVRVGLSGSALLHKDKTKNMDIESFFGPEVYSIKNMDLMEMGYSTPLVVKIIMGNSLIKIPGDYTQEYNLGIIESKEREDIIIERLRFYLSRKIYPILITCRFHNHVENIFNRIKLEFGDKYKITYIHHKVKDRKKILDDFKVGKSDILVSSLLIKIGQNMPLIRYMLNASSGDSHINVLQLVGRLIRTHKSKSKVYLEDIYDKGSYLMRHSKHRILHYKKEGFKVLELYKKSPNYKKKL